MVFANKLDDKMRRKKTIDKTVSEIQFSHLNPIHLDTFDIPYNSLYGQGTGEKINLPESKNRIAGLKRGRIYVYQARFIPGSKFNISKNGKTYVKIPDCARQVSLPEYRLCEKRGHSYGKVYYY